MAAPASGGAGARRPDVRRRSGRAAKIFELLRDAASEGLGILFFSTEPEQLAAMCSRVLVLRDGVIAAALTGRRASTTRRSVVGATHEHGDDTDRIPSGAAFDSRKAGPMRRFVDVVFSRYASVALLLALLIIAFSILSPQFLTNRNWQNLLVVQSVVTCMCFAATMPLIVGEFDLSLGIDDRLSGDARRLSRRAGLTAAIVIPAMLIAGVAGRPRSMAC